MNLRDWFEHHSRVSATFIFIILTLTISKIYVRASENFLLSLGLYGIENAIASVTIRFIISSLSLILLFYALYKQPRSIKEYRQKLQAVRGYSWRTTIEYGLVSFTIFAIVSHLH
jgi:hypothetical protein